MSKQHKTEFKREAVRVALTSGLSRKQVAADFKIGFYTLARWIQLERQISPEPMIQSDLEKEVANLRKENRPTVPGGPARSACASVETWCY
jgi:transposase